jgi:hypothetical protein
MSLPATRQENVSPVFDFGDMKSCRLQPARFALTRFCILP